MSPGIRTLIWLALLVPSITFHEYLHAWSAYRLGDPTAKLRGRLTLNPLRHLDPFGTVLLPLLLALTGAPIFGYAKPVPVDPRYFRNVRTGELVTGVAGPFANLLLALAGSAIAWAAYRWGAPFGRVTEWAFIVGVLLVRTNLILMLFNLIPIPPLDGSSVVPLFLSDAGLRRWYELQQYSFGILLLLLWGVPALTGFSPLSAYFSLTADPLMRLLLPG